MTGVNALFFAALLAGCTQIDSPGLFSQSDEAVDHSNLGRQSGNQWTWLDVCNAARTDDFLRVRESFSHMPPSDSYPALFPFTRAEVCAFNASVRASEFDTAHSILMGVIERGANEGGELGVSSCDPIPGDRDRLDRWVRGFGRRELLIDEYLALAHSRQAVEVLSQCLRQATQSNRSVTMRLMRHEIRAELQVGSIERASNVASEIMSLANAGTDCTDANPTYSAEACFSPGDVWVEWPLHDLFELSDLSPDHVADCDVAFEVDPSGEVDMGSISLGDCATNQDLHWLVSNALNARVYLPVLVDGEPIARRLRLAWPQTQDEH